MDIEDLVEFGKKHRACPFYLSKEQSRVELIFLPYNYLWTLIQGNRKI